MFYTAYMHINTTVYCLISYTCMRLLPAQLLFESVSRVALHVPLPADADAAVGVPLVVVSTGAPHARGQEVGWARAHARGGVKHLG